MNINVINMDWTWFVMTLGSTVIHVASGNGTTLHKALCGRKLNPMFRLQGHSQPIQWVCEQCATHEEVFRDDEVVIPIGKNHA